MCGLLKRDCDRLSYLTWHHISFKQLYQIRMSAERRRRRLAMSRSASCCKRISSTQPSSQTAYGDRLIAAVKFPKHCRSRHAEWLTTIGHFSIFHHQHANMPSLSFAHSCTRSKQTSCSVWIQRSGSALAWLLISPARLPPHATLQLNARYAAADQRQRWMQVKVMSGRTSTMMYTVRWDKWIHVFFSVQLYTKTAVLNGFVQFWKEVCAVLTRFKPSSYIYPLKRIKVSQFGM